MRAITCAVLTLPLVAGCESHRAELAQTVADERTAEAAIEAIEAIEEPTAAQTQLLREYRALEAELEKQRIAWEAVQAPALIGRGVDASRDIATSNWFGLIEGIVALGAAAATAFGAKQWASADTRKRLADLESRRDESRVVQGGAPASAHSAVAAQSLAAKAARAAQAREQADIATAAAKAQYDAMRAADRDQANLTASLAPRTAPERPSVDVEAILRDALGPPIPDPSVN